MRSVSAIIAGVAGATLLFGSVPANAQEQAQPQRPGTVVPGGMTATPAAAPERPAAPLPACTDIVYPGDTGSIFARTSPQGTVAWGIYMHDPALNAGPWTVDVYVGKTRVDHKQQDYAPHGSVAPAQAKKGQVFSITSTHVDPAGTTHYNVPNGCVI